MEPSRFSFDLLAWRPVRALVASRGFPLTLQVIALAAVVFLVVNGLGRGLGMRADELMTFRKTNLTTLVVWGLWWPGMIAMALLLGRAWCTVCPMELVNRVDDATGRSGQPLGKSARVRSALSISADHPGRPGLALNSRALLWLTGRRCAGQVHRLGSSGRGDQKMEAHRCIDATSATS